MLFAVLFAVEVFLLNLFKMSVNGWFYLFVYIINILLLVYTMGDTDVSRKKFGKSVVVVVIASRSHIKLIKLRFIDAH